MDGVDEQTKRSKDGPRRERILGVAPPISLNGIFAQSPTTRS